MTRGIAPMTRLVEVERKEAAMANWNGRDGLRVGRGTRWKSAIAAIGIVSAGLGVFVLSGARVDAQAGPGVVIMFGDSFASGEGGGWKGNAMNGSGDRSGTDMAAQNNFGNWYYYPQFRVYEERSWTDECHASRTSPIW